MSLYTALSNLYVGSKSGDVHCYQLVDIASKEKDTPRSSYELPIETDSEYHLMYRQLTQLRML